MYHLKKKRVFVFSIRIKRGINYQPNHGNPKRDHYLICNLRFSKKMYYYDGKWKKKLWVFRRKKKKCEGKLWVFGRRKKNCEKCFFQNFTIFFRTCAQWLEIHIWLIESFWKVWPFGRRCVGGECIKIAPSLTFFFSFSR